MTWHLGSELPRGGNFLTRWLGRLVFSAFGWKIEGEFPNREKAIVALVPHSSNIDFFLAAAFIWGTGMRASFLVKHTVFWFPLGIIIRVLGGIPVDRTRANGLVADVIRQFQEKSKLVVGLTPSGTRKPVREWKDGIARIAAATKVPIVPVVMNYRTKTVHLAPLIEAVNEVGEIMSQVRAQAAHGVPRFSN